MTWAPATDVRLHSAIVGVERESFARVAEGCIGGAVSGADVEYAERYSSHPVWMVRPEYCCTARHKRGGAYEFVFMNA